MSHGRGPLRRGWVLADDQGSLLMLIWWLVQAYSILRFYRESALFFSRWLALNRRYIYLEIIKIIFWKLLIIRADCFSCKMHSQGLVMIVNIGFLNHCVMTFDRLLRKRWLLKGLLLLRSDTLRVKSAILKLQGCFASTVLHYELFGIFEHCLFRVEVFTWWRCSY